MMKKPEKNLLVIFGASGDLTRRKLIPGLFNLYRRGLLPDQFAILGASRRDYDDQVFRQSMLEGIEEFANTKDCKKEVIDHFLQSLYYEPIDIKNPDDYQRLNGRLKEITDTHQTGGNVLFYMSTPPSLFNDIVTNLGALDLQQQNGGWRRLIVEKPFGYDLESALKLNKQLHAVFNESQIFRIDHYLGKETVQNLLVLRFGNGIFEPLWNRNYVSHVEITSAEKIGVGNRGGYYDHSGALRDMFQNHLMQIVGMVGMEPPSKFNADAVRNETIKVFEAIRPLAVDRIEESVVRGQYRPAMVRGNQVNGYRQENGVPEDSRTETYVAVKFFIDNWRWSGVPFLVRTGKNLPTRVTEVVIHFKQTPHHLFVREGIPLYDHNKLVIRIQPDEGILMKFNMKLPGGGFEVKTVNMDFHYDDLTDAYVPQAYERLLLDCMLGDATLYARGDAVEACWKFVKPIQEAWETRSDLPVYGYPAGTWGPKEATELFGEKEMDWRYPCSNMNDDGEYCEL